MILEPTHLPAAAAYLAAGSNPLNVGELTTILGTVFGLVILTVGIRLGMHAHGSNIAAVLTGVGIVFLGVMVFGLATGHNLLGKLGADLVGAFLNI